MTASWGQVAPFLCISLNIIFYSTLNGQCQLTCLCASVICHLYPCSMPCITSGINQSELISYLSAPVSWKLLCKPLWEINTSLLWDLTFPRHIIYIQIPPHCVHSFSSEFFSFLSVIEVPLSAFQVHRYTSFWFLLLHQASVRVLCCLFFVLLFLQQLIDIFSPHNQSSDGRQNNPSPACL